MSRSTMVRVSFAVAAAVATLRTIDYMRMAKTYSLWNEIRMTADQWMVVVVLLAVLLTVRDGQSHLVSGIMIGASLVVAPFAVLAAMAFFSGAWPWVVVAVAVLPGVASLWRIPTGIEGNGKQ